MGLPSTDISFKTAAAQTIAFGDKGTLALILRDSKLPGSKRLTGAAQIPTTLSADNQAYIKRAFIGYVNPPKAVLLYVLPKEAADLTDALTYFATQQFDYLCAPPEATEAEVLAVTEWVKVQRKQSHMVKAILPTAAADNEAIINVTAEDLTDGKSIYTAAQYCSRVAGIIAGTPWTMSATYAPLPDLTDVKRLTREEADTAINAGNLIFVHDGRKVKIGRAVNSLKTKSGEKSAAFQKIKIVEVVDRINQDIRSTIEDSFIGKHSGSYDEKLLLVTAIRQYLHKLEVAGILQQGVSAVDIDTSAIRLYLDNQGVDTSEMSEADLRSMDTGSQVFLTVTIRILDAIEDVTIVVNM